MLSRVISVDDDITQLLHDRDLKAHLGTRSYNEARGKSKAL